MPVLYPVESPFGKNFSILKTIKKPLIIICKGIQKNSHFEKCPFIHNGDWGDVELVEHEKFHKLLDSRTYSWLGFDVPRSFGTYSGRDGKRN